MITPWRAALVCVCLFINVGLKYLKSLCVGSRLGVCACRKFERGALRVCDGEGGVYKVCLYLWAKCCGTFTLVQSTPAHPNVRRNEMQPSFKLANSDYHCSTPQCLIQC